VGESRFNAIEVDYSRRFTSSFNININYQRTFQYDRDWFTNRFDQLPTGEDTVGNSRLLGWRAQRLEASIWERSEICQPEHMGRLSHWKMATRCLVRSPAGSTYRLPEWLSTPVVRPSWQSCDTNRSQGKAPELRRLVQHHRVQTRPASQPRITFAFFRTSVDGVRSNGVNELEREPAKDDSHSRACEF